MHGMSRCEERKAQRALGLSNAAWLLLLCRLVLVRLTALLLILLTGLLILLGRLLVLARLLVLLRACCSNSDIGHRIFFRISAQKHFRTGIATGYWIEKYKERAMI
jgi:hypothetical protein